MVKMITGYKGTGKDYLFSDLSNYNRDTFPWIVLAKPGLEAFNIRTGNKKIPLNRVAFADSLKKKLIDSYNLPLSIDQLNDLKDTPATYINPQHTYRDYLIKMGKDYRDIDPDHWIKQVLINETIDSSSFITDWRFPNEHHVLSNHFPITTVRVFRSCVPVPIEESEHHLDSFVTDYVFLPREDKSNLLRLFPQYDKHVQVYVNE